MVWEYPFFYGRCRMEKKKKKKEKIETRNLDREEESASGKRTFFFPIGPPTLFFFTPSRIFQRIPWVVHPRKWQWQNLRRVINPRRNSRKKLAKKKGKGERKFKTPWRVLIIKRRNHRGRKKRGKSYNPPRTPVTKIFCSTSCNGGPLNRRGESVS